MAPLMSEYSAKTIAFNLSKHAVSMLDFETLTDMTLRLCIPDTQADRKRYIETVERVADSEYTGDRVVVEKLLRFLRHTPLTGQSYAEKRLIDKRLGVRRYRERQNAE